MGSDSMVRKQIYIGRHHDALLKGLARARRVSEAALIREALDRQVETEAALPWSLDPDAWDAAMRFMRRLQRRRGRPAARRWKREDAYQGRLR